MPGRIRPAYPAPRPIPPGLTQCSCCGQLTDNHDLWEIISAGKSKGKRICAGCADDLIRLHIGC